MPGLFYGARTMANAGRRNVNYTPRMTDEQAYEELPKPVRDALKVAVTDWCSYSLLRRYRKLCKGGMWSSEAAQKVIQTIEYSDINYMEKGWIVKRGRGHNVPSTYVACGVEPLRRG